MKDFLGDDFLLDTEPARRLYHDSAAPMPILDYHSHLPPEAIAGDAHFENLAQLWLGGDHYKWRLMRANGVPETEITGRVPDWKSFLAWAHTVPRALGNPIYHWTHLELRRYFGVNDLLGPDTAERIWRTCNEQIADPSFSVLGLLKRMNVTEVCTTDDPVDALGFHRLHAESGRSPVLLPTFRPDRALACSEPTWPTYVDSLGMATGVEVQTYRDLVRGLELRHQYFHELGCRLSDHALVSPPCAQASDEELERVFQKARLGQPLTPVEVEAFQTSLLVEVGRWNCDRGWTMQIHLGALRNLNSRLANLLGPDTGWDAISDEPLARRIASLLDRLDQSGLPQLVVYPANPAAYDAVAAVLGSFQDGRSAGRVQLGSAWWFNDHIDGMTRQLTAVANHGLLSRFVGMLTDSRSFLSFPRHEYFRRVFCNLVGGWVEKGLAPADFGLLGELVRAVCYNNARELLRLPGLE